MIEKLKILAENVRQTISTVISESEYVDCELQNFPSGSCEVASVITGLYLKKVGIENVSQSVGKRQIHNDINTNNHVWITVDSKYIVDITANQFNDCNEKFIVSEQSEFHNSFKVYDTRPVDFSYLTRCGSEGYGSFYAKVLEKLENT